MNIVVGYVQSTGDEARLEEEIRALLALGCQTVRVEEARTPDRLFKPVLESVCEFLGPDDELAAPDLTHLGSCPSAAEAFLARLSSRGARLRLLDAAPMDLAHAGRSEAAGVSAPKLGAPVTSGRIDAGLVRALSDDGFGPTQIARKLGVSRMTVWRKLAAAGA